MTKIGAFRLFQPGRPRAGAPVQHGSTPRSLATMARGEEAHGTPQHLLGVDPVVIDAIQRLSTDDPDRPGKAFKLFLSHSIRKELAHHGLSPSAAQVLTDSTWERMREDPALREDIAKAQEELLVLRASKIRAPKSS